MNQLSLEEHLKRLARVKASGLTYHTYSNLMGLNKNHVGNSIRSIRNRTNLTEDQIFDKCTDYISVYRSFMDSTPVRRADFLDIYDQCRDLGLNDPRKSAALSKYLSDNGYDEYTYRKMRTGYEFYNDIFRQLSDSDRLATMNANSAHDGPIKLVVTPSLYPITKSEFALEDTATEDTDEPEEESIFEDTDEPEEGRVISGRFPWGDDNITIVRECDALRSKCLLTVTTTDKDVTKTVAIDFPFDPNNAAHLFELAEVFAGNILDR